MVKTEKQTHRQYDSSIAVKSETINALNAMNFDIPKGAIVEKLANGLMLAYEKQLQSLLKRLQKNGKAHEIFKTVFMFEVDSQQRILVVPKLKVVSENVGINDPEPTASEIEEKCFGDKN